MYWFRVVPRDGVTWRPALRAMLRNTVLAAHRWTIDIEVLGSSHATPSQLYDVLHKPVLEGELLQVREPASAPPPAQGEHVEEDGEPDAESSNAIWKTWRPVDDFLSSDPGDRHYVIDRTRGVDRIRRWTARAHSSVWEQQRAAASLRERRRCARQCPGGGSQPAALGGALHHRRQQPDPRRGRRRHRADGPRAAPGRHAAAPSSASGDGGGLPGSGPAGIASGGTRGVPSAVRSLAGTRSPTPAAWPRECHRRAQRIDLPSGARPRAVAPGSTASRSLPKHVDRSRRRRARVRRNRCRGERSRWRRQPGGRCEPHAQGFDRVVSASALRWAARRGLAPGRVAGARRAVRAVRFHTGSDLGGRVTRHSPGGPRGVAAVAAVLDLFWSSPRRRQVHARAHWHPAHRQEGAGECL